MAGEIVHLDSKKLFKPVLLDSLCDVLVHYILNNRSQKVLINVGVDRATTYYELVRQIALTAGIDTKLVQPDGEETGWPLNSTLSVERARGLGYPEIRWDGMLAKIREDLPLVPKSQLPE
jgi:dTDP-4-dehydrorhamnose reductase